MPPSAEQQTPPKEVDFEQVIDAMAKAVCEGDIVNFRLLFSPFSPARESSNESFDMPKYAYLLPDDEMAMEKRFAASRALVKHPQTASEIKRELGANRPPQLPWELMLELADNAVRRGKYSSAALAYELLRVRARIQRDFLEHADAALDAGSIPTAVRGYIIATSLAYDYAAFPEPLPVTPDFQTRALMLHAEYPARLEDCIGLREPQALLQTALAYLLLDAEAAARLDSRSMEVRLAFLKELARQRDPEWESFVPRLRETGDAADDLLNRLRERYSAPSFAEEMDNRVDFADEDDPRRIPAMLLGYSIEDGEWWQYLKELVYRHPAAALLVARQAVGEIEVILPRYAQDSPVIHAFGV
jgi:hypothetical protein